MASAMQSSTLGILTTFQKLSGPERQNQARKPNVQESARIQAPVGNRAPRRLSMAEYGFPLWRLPEGAVIYPRMTIQAGIWLFGGPCNLIRSP